MQLDPKAVDLLKNAGVFNDPQVICKLLRAIAGGTEAQASRIDTILIGAAEMIEAFARRKP